ncbi:MAG TPA: hypothetical protein VK780_09490 [Thermoanaerobaculia bacterium]|nr:hypothetical protein [Thermoanaerobaculia bacterium]
MRRVSARLAARWVGTAALALLLLARNRPSELAARVRSVVAFAPRELAVRRLGGSSAAFDRQYFLFLESARRRLPKGTAGVALVLPGPSQNALHLAAYTMAPIPVAVSHGPVPSGWIAAVYGPERPPGWRLLAEVPGGALMAPGASPG